MKGAIPVVIGSIALGCLADDPLTPDKVEADIKTVELERNLQNLSQIAYANNGNRAFGLPGYKASVDFILSRTQIPQMNTTVQPFNYTFEHTRNITIRGPKGEGVFVLSPQFNNPTPLPAGITAPVVAVPEDSTRGSGCVEDQWAGLNATGKLVLIRRNGCRLVVKASLAKKHGAVGILFYNTFNGTNYISPSLSAAGIGSTLPAGLIPQEVGRDWATRLASGENLTATLVVDSMSEMRECWNVISETKEGDPNSVVMLGAHLDSVQRGPGINDDGSGVTALLEIMSSIKKYKGFKNKVRFAWWGAEEAGLVGSSHYTERLSEKEADSIRYYINYDMVGSIHPIYMVGRNNDSGIGATIMYDYIKSQGKPVEYDTFEVGSDYVGFIELGIPGSCGFTGDEDDQDPCYHKECDTLDNINWEALTIFAKAAGRAAAQLAVSLEGIPPRNKTRKKTFSSLDPRFV